MDEDQFFLASRNHMVDEQIASRDITNPRVLNALRRIPRHLFVPAEFRRQAYADCPLPIGLGQTISQPYIVALMTQLLDLKGDETILEVGTGSGYQAAILASLAAQVHTIERHRELAHSADRLLSDLGITNVHVHQGDGSLGLPDLSPFNGILVTAAAPVVPEPLLQQLAESGRLVIPVGDRFVQYLEYWQRSGSEFRKDRITSVAFVPLVGSFGWREDD
jgi:protein-L-isoaspartate(D-aspartate) O-methyltransferase